MNQILVTKKMYITPELKRKKKIYKINFILSVILIVILISIYVYAEYDRNKNEYVSQDILNGMVAQKIENDDTTINSDDEVWIIALDGGKETISEASKEQNNEATKSISQNNTKTKNANQEIKKESALIGTYKASNGKTYNTVGTINIPSINVNYPILTETSESLLKISVCKFWGCDPNQVGNFCIAGHNYRNTRFFSKVPTLVVGDIIEITDLYNTTLKYSIYDKYTVDPKDVSCTSQLTNGKKVVTLITCTNDSKQRVVIQAREI